jgi:hypothetical protein
VNHEENSHFSNSTGSGSCIFGDRRISGNLCCNDDVLRVDHERSVYELHHGNVLRLSDNVLPSDNVLLSDNDVLSSSHDLLQRSVLLLLVSIRRVNGFSAASPLGLASVLKP